MRDPYEHPGWRGRLFLLVIEGRDDTEPVVNRLKLWLKQGQRAFRLKCREIKDACHEVPHETEDGHHA